MLRSLVTLFLITFSASFANAVDKKYNISSTDQVEINSDEMFFDRVKNIAFASGNVEISQGEDKLTADKAIFQHNTNVIYLVGNVVLKRPDGNVIFSDKARLIKNANKGIVINFKARMGKNTLLVSRNAEVINENVIVMEDMKISPCKVCSSNYRSNIPLWQFRAKKATLNTGTERVNYNDAKLDFLGMPIFYSPFLSTPSPGAKRKSGFLFPRFKYATESQGYGIGIPYYWNIAPNKDATLIPVLSSKSGTMLQGEFRHKIKKGEYEISGSITRTDKITKQGAKITGKEEIKGHYEVAGNYNFENKWHKAKMLFNSKRVFDHPKTYLRKYKISDEKILKTDLSYNVSEKRNLYILRALDFQDLRESRNNKTTPRALPSIDLHHERPLGYKGIKLMSDVNMLNLNRMQGTSYQRISVSETLQAPFKLPKGQMLQNELELRGDFYQVHKKNIYVSDTLTKLNNRKEGSEGRIYPELRSEWSLPLYRNIESNILIIEPVVQLVLTPHMKNLEKVGNEDSQDPEISASNLFSPNRYVGFDKIESGPRLNYGFRSNFSSRNFRNVNLIFGQSLRKTRDPNFDRNSGLDGYVSDFVGKISVQPDEHIFINDNFRLKEDSIAPLRNEINLEFVYPKWNLSLAHMWIDESLLPKDSKKYRQEVALKGKINLYREWWFDASGSRRLGKKIANDQSKNVKATLGLSFLSECLHARLSVTRDYAKVKDLKKEDTYKFSIIIPTY